MILKFGMKHGALQSLYKHDDPGMTLTYFMARSALNGKMSFNMENVMGIGKWTEDLCL